MKWFSFFKNKSGKLKIGVAHVVAVAGVGTVLAFTAFNAEKEAVQKQLEARSLSSISNAYNYGGLRQTKEGLSSMNMANLSGGLDRIATAEERARIEAARTGNGQFGLDAAENMDRNVSSAMSGLASQTGDSEGLGMGKNAVVMQNNTSGSANANTPYVSADAIAGRGQNARAASGAANQLAPASVRTSGGSVTNSSFGGSSSAAGMSGRSGSSSSSGSSGRGEGYRLSGAMPGGTNPVSMRGEGGRSSSGFRSGRDFSSSQGQRFKSTGNDLKDISRQSRKVAANVSTAAANAGSQPFLASATTSGGMGFTHEDVTDSTISPDLDTETPHLKAIDDWGEKQDTIEQDRNQKMATLFAVMWGLVAVTIAAVPIIRNLRKLGAVPVIGTIAGNAAAIALTAVVGALWLALIGHSFAYWHKFCKPEFSPLALTCSLVAVAGIAAVLIALLGVPAGKTTGKNALTKDAIKELMGKVSSGAKGMAMTGFNQGLNLGKTAAQDALTDAETNHNKNKK